MRFKIGRHDKELVLRLEPEHAVDELLLSHPVKNPKGLLRPFDFIHIWREEEAIGLRRQKVVLGWDHWHGLLSDKEICVPSRLSGNVMDTDYWTELQTFNRYLLPNDIRRYTEFRKATSEECFTLFMLYRRNILELHDTKEFQSLLLTTLRQQKIDRLLAV